MRALRVPRVCQSDARTTTKRRHRGGVHALLQTLRHAPSPTSGPVCTPPLAPPLRVLVLRVVPLFVLPAELPMCQRAALPRRLLVFSPRWRDGVLLYITMASSPSHRKTQPALRQRVPLHMLRDVAHRKASSPRRMWRVVSSSPRACRQWRCARRADVWRAAFSRCARAWSLWAAVTTPKT